MFGCQIEILCFSEFHLPLEIVSYIVIFHGQIDL